MRLSRDGLLSGVFLVVLVVATVLGPRAGAEEKPASDEDFGELLDGVVAVVGDLVVTRSDLAQAMAYPAALLKAKQDAGLPEAKVQDEFRQLQVETRDNLVDNKLILLAGQADGMNVDDEIRRRMEKLKASFEHDPEKLAGYLKARGHASPEEYERQMREEMLRQRVVFGLIRPRAEVTEDEVMASFQERYGKLRKQPGECEGAMVKFYSLEQIWFPMKEASTFSALHARYTAAYRCYLGLVAGDFAAADADTRCGSTESPAAFGALGEVDETKSFDPAFQEAFEKLTRQPDLEFSEPFVIQDGVRILRVTSTREGCVADSNEVVRLKHRLKARLEEKKFEKVLRWWLQELRGKFRVDLKKL